MPFPFSSASLLSPMAKLNTADRLMEVLSRRPVLLKDEVAGVLSISPEESEKLLRDLQKRGRVEVRKVRGGVAVSAGKA